MATLSELGLGYLSLDRSTPTLSPGELQRLRLATQIRSNLFGVVYVLDEPPCPTCHGARYNDDTLKVTYGGKNIAEVLGMTVREAREFFANEPSVLRSLRLLQDIVVAASDWVRHGAGRGRSGRAHCCKGYTT